MTKKKVPTIRDVAAAAGVSTATVSKFINGGKRFSPAVEAHIQQVITELGYCSNPQAQSMITGRTRSIGIAILDITNPHFTSLVKGANRVAIEHGYSVLLVDTEENLARERPLVEALNRRVDGMLLYSRLPEKELEWLVGFDKPVVYYGRLQQLALPSVSGDDAAGAALLTQYLVGHGHRKIAYLGFPKSHRSDERKSGILAGLKGTRQHVHEYAAEAPTAEEGERLCASIMLGGDRPDALICYNDLIALGFMKEAQTLGFKLPEDISVAGFDNIPYGRFVFPPLTTVDLQSEKMGMVGMERLLAAIEGKEGDSLSVVEPQLILRASTASRRR
ncbi:MAG: LacI family DNA-binding transcriptional regulator [Pseudomonadota bacterium]